MSWNSALIVAVRYGSIRCVCVYGVRCLSVITVKGCRVVGVPLCERCYVLLSFVDMVNSSDRRETVQQSIAAATCLLLNECLLAAYAEVHFVRLFIFCQRYTTYGHHRAFTEQGLLAEGLSTGLFAFTVKRSFRSEIRWPRGGYKG